MKKFEHIIINLSQENPEALLADGFEEALIGVARRTGQPTLAVYDVSKCIKVLKDKHDLTEEEAWEYFDFNVAGSWMGENTPIFFDNLKGL